MKNGKETYKVEILGNRRKDVRTPTLVLRVNDAEKNVFFGYAKNISKSGMFISTISPREVGDEFLISFELLDAKIHVTCQCKVVWVREFDPKLKSKPGMGLKFLSIDDETAKKLEEWVLQA